MSGGLSGWKQRWRHSRDLEPNSPHHPAVVAQFEKRASDAQLRVADDITAFAGSMQFVYIHIVAFVVWMAVLEKSPWPTLTLAVSLEAIFLSTFVMIGQNRQSAFQQAKADGDYRNTQLLLEENTRLTRLIHELTAEVHARIVDPASAATAGRPPESPGEPAEGPDR